MGASLSYKVFHIIKNDWSGFNDLGVRIVTASPQLLLYSFSVLAGKVLKARRDKERRMVEFSECTNSYGAEKKKCENNVAFKEGAKMGDALEANSPTVQADVKRFEEMVATDPQSYRMLKAFYEGMRSRSDEVHISENNNQLDVFIDFGVRSKVDSVANGIKQWTASTELPPDKALANGLQEANNKLHRMNTDVKRQKGQNEEQYKRAVQDQKWEREDFVRGFNEQSVPGVKAELDKRGHVKIVRTQ